MKKILRHTARALGLIFIIANAAILITGKTYLYPAAWYNFAEIEDYRIFPNRLIAADNPQPWPVSAQYNTVKIGAATLDDIERYDPVAFLVVRRDSLLYEKYWEGYGPLSLSNSFSMAKTYVGVLTGIAVAEGKIRALDQAVADFIPSFRRGEKAKITVRHLLTMSSGLNWDESYVNPLSVTTEAYYGTDLLQLVDRMQVVEEPGKRFEYLSGNTLVLGVLLERATGQKLSDYLSEKLWKPMGCEQDALWSLDRDGGTEKPYCCINSGVRDFARLGKLFLHNGNWDGVQLVERRYAEESLRPAPLADGDKALRRFGYSWWLMTYRDRDIFYARGILGQYIICIPHEQLIVCRLGHRRSRKQTEGHPDDIFHYIDAGMEAAGISDRE